VNFTLGANVERLTLTGGAAGLAGTGNTLDNVLTANDAGSSLAGLAGADTLVGGAGDDTLAGGSGADQMSGAAGNDVYYVDDANDVVTEAAGAGTDLVYTSVGYTLPTNVDNGTLASNTAAQALVGNALDNVLTASTYADTLSGAAGNDTLVLNSSNYLAASVEGGAGSDTLRITGLASGTAINLGSLASHVNNVEVIDIKDSASEFVSISASSIQGIVGQGNGSSLTLHLDASDSIVVQPGNYYSVSAGGTAYTFYNSDPTLGGATQIAQLHVSTA
jgi:hypothetical protein